MKWFKHHTNASEGTSLNLIFDKYGHKGYAYYFLFLEVIAEKYDANYAKINGENFHIHERKLKEKLKINYKKLSEFLQFSDSILLFSVKKVEKIYQIEMPKIRSILDNHTKNLQVTCKKLTGNLPLELDKEKEKEKEREGEAVSRKPHRPKRPPPPPEILKGPIEQFQKTNDLDLCAALKNVTKETQNSWVAKYRDKGPLWLTQMLSNAAAHYAIEAREGNKKSGKKISMGGKLSGWIGRSAKWGEGQEFVITPEEENIIRARKEAQKLEEIQAIEREAQLEKDRMEMRAWAEEQDKKTSLSLVP